MTLPVPVPPQRLDRQKAANDNRRLISDWLIEEWFFDQQRTPEAEELVIGAWLPAFAPEASGGLELYHRRPQQPGLHNRSGHPSFDYTGKYSPMQIIERDLL